MSVLDGCSDTPESIFSWPVVGPVTATNAHLLGDSGCFISAQYDAWLPAELHTLPAPSVCSPEIILLSRSNLLP